MIVSVFIFKDITVRWHFLLTLMTYKVHLVVLSATNRQHMGYYSDLQALYFISGSKKSTQCIFVA